MIMAEFFEREAPETVTVNAAKPVPQPQPVMPRTVSAPITGMDTGAAPMNQPVPEVSRVKLAPVAPPPAPATAAAPMTAAPTAGIREWVEPTRPITVTPPAPLYAPMPRTPEPIVKQPVELARFIEVTPPQPIYVSPPAPDRIQPPAPVLVPTQAPIARVGQVGSRPTQIAPPRAITVTAEAPRTAVTPPVIMPPQPPRVPIETARPVNRTPEPEAPRESSATGITMNAPKTPERAAVNVVPVASAALRIEEPAPAPSSAPTQDLRRFVPALVVLGLAFIIFMLRNERD